jgi:hypothetical protein
LRHRHPEMTFGVSNIDRALLLNNVVMLAKGATTFVNFPHHLIS